VTTGDALGDHVLYRLNEQGLLTSNDRLGIFKIPHHGSRYNSLVDKLYQPKNPEKEKLHYFWLALTAPYALPRMVSEKDKGLINSVIIALTDYHSYDWVAQNIPRSNAGFEATLGDLSDNFRRFIANENFVYRDPKSGNSELHLGNDNDLIAFVLLLAERYSDILAAAYADNPGDVREAQDRTYVGSSVLRPDFVLMRFMQYDYVPIVLPVPGQARSLFQEIRPDYLSLINLLEMDPALEVLYQKEIYAFYQQFQLVILHSFIGYMAFRLSLERTTMLYLLMGNMDIHIHILSPAS
jgi:hypothetical protein